ncbi:DNA adenine methylase [Acidithiobacillus sp. CV18-2]|nr:DNA adenine methylase [Acidithiobacillus sp. CV18-3]MBU2755984.1 DNA adenine methylase [Acidithiobacillus sp. BN09-2]MBU2777267.1 DNA adenine methylase [Acidithiobacillus sp. CV18-2]MBU2799883.1 DNA adenine methylase [Acidithiobacillus sp. VAN18-4]
MSVEMDFLEQCHQTTRVGTPQGACTPQGMRQRYQEPAMTAFPWLGGKGWMRKKLGHRLPRKLQCYVEPFAGAAAMLLGLPRMPVEVLNDRNQDLVNFYRVMQRPASRETLLDRLRWTPYARDEFVRALQMLEGADQSMDKVERAWAFFVVANATFSGGGQSGITENRFATSSQRSQGQRMHYHIDGLPGIAERLRHVVIENRCAQQILPQYDSPDTLFFLDPPYFPETRSIRHETSRGTYAGGEMSAQDHIRMLEICLDLDGYVVLCGYPHEAYDDVLLPHGWEILTFDRHAMTSLHRDQQKSQRQECLWINPKMARHFAQGTQQSLFG